MKEVTQGYAAPGGEQRLVVTRQGVSVVRFGVAVQTGRVLSEPNWGNVLAERRKIAA